MDCVHRCPELDACINSSLWCDGVDHCPSGYDEAAKHCSFILQLPLLYLALGAAGILVICCSLSLIACSACRGRRRSKHHSRIMSLPSDTSTFGKEVICWHSDNSVRYEEVDRVTTVWLWRRHLRAWIRNSALCSMAAWNRIFFLRHSSASITIRRRQSKQETEEYCPNKRDASLSWQIFAGVSSKPTASILGVQAHPIYTTKQGATFHNSAIFIIIALRTWNINPNIGSLSNAVQIAIISTVDWL